MAEHPALRGIDLGPVTEWLAANLPFHRPPYRFELVAAGGSNLTYIVTSADGTRFVLRRPPVRARIATAHDMQREYRIMAALAKPPSHVPVPAMLAYCDDTAITGAEFYCMEMVTGVILRDRASTAGMSAEDCRRATESLVEAQVAFHQVDLAAVGLADLAQHHGYVERQLKRWLQQVAAAATRDVPEFQALHDQLYATRPTAPYRPGLAHGDYRFDNTIMDADYNVAAVLDWELCTIGDPLADFVWSLNYWAEPGETLHWLLDPPTQNPLFPRRSDVIAQYAERSGVPVTHLEWYNAFSWWKQACIVEGVYARLQQGAGGGMQVASLDQVGQRVLDYLARARELFERV